MGTPVLASDLGNVGAMVRPGVDGLRFAPGDAAALAEAVRALPALGEKMDPAAVRAAAWPLCPRRKRTGQHDREI